MVVQCSMASVSGSAGVLPAGCKLSFSIIVFQKTVVKELFPPWHLRARVLDVLSACFRMRVGASGIDGERGPGATPLNGIAPRACLPSQGIKAWGLMVAGCFSQRHHQRACVVRDLSGGVGAVWCDFFCQ